MTKKLNHELLAWEIHRLHIILELLELAQDITKQKLPSSDEILNELFNLIERTKLQEPILYDRIIK